MKRLLPWLIAVPAIAGLFWIFPLFRIVPLERAAQEKAAATFDPKAFAETFWNQQLLKHLDHAVPAERLLAAIQKDPAAAKKAHARSLGVSDSYTFFISGKGRVVAVNDDEISLAITDDTTPEISLQAGLLFSNAVRDGTDLLSVNSFPNSQDYNAIGESLNRLIETRVQPHLRELAKVGTTLRFVGCAEVNDEAVDLKPLKVVPIQIEAQ